MTQQDALTTNQLIGTLTEAIMLMEQQETAFYDYLADNDGAVDAAFLKKQIDNSIEIVSENAKLLKTICELKDSGNLRFLDEKPFRIAILRLKAAMSQAEAACGQRTGVASR